MWRLTSWRFGKILNPSEIQTGDRMIRSYTVYNSPILSIVLMRCKLDSYSRQVFIYLDPILIYVSLCIDSLFEIRKIAVCFLWLSLPGNYRITNEALLAETT